MRTAPLLLACCALLLLGVPTRARAEDEPARAPEVQVEILEPGSGEPAAEGDRVTIDYILRLEDGTEVGSTYARHRPYTLTIEPGRAIPGMLKALTGLRMGAKVRATIPSALAYGKRGKPSRKPGAPPVIPGDATLVYEIAVREVWRRPRFPSLDPKQVLVTSTGLRYWVLKPGQGEPAEANQRVRMAYVLWNEKHEFVYGTQSRTHWIDGQADKLRLMRRPDAVRRRQGVLPAEPLLSEAALLMRPGMRCLFEAPADLTWGTARAHPLIAPGSMTFWRLEVVSVSDIPAFRMPRPEELTTSDSGLRYLILDPGTGPEVTKDARVETQYQGWLESGKRFDSSFLHGATQEFRVKGVVAGFSEGLMKLREGGRAILVIPAKLGYGGRGVKGLVPPGATLVFDVEVIRVK